MLNLPTNVICLGPIQSAVYCVYNNKLFVYDINGTLLHFYDINITLGTVLGITSFTTIQGDYDYDGALFYTVEAKHQDTIFRKWELDFNQHSLVLLKTTIYSDDSSYRFNYAGFTIQRYDRYLTRVLYSGSKKVYINNLSSISVLDTCLIGPSTVGEAKGKLFTTRIIAIHTDYIEVEEDSPYDFLNGTSVVIRGALVFASTTGLGGSSIPMLYYLDSETFSVVKDKSVYCLAAVKGIYFLNNLLYMVSKYTIYLYNCELNTVYDIIYTYQHCVNYFDVFGVIPMLGNTFFTVQQSYATFANFTCTTYNYSNYGLVNNLLNAYPNIVAIIVDNFLLGDDGHGVVEVMDQYGRGMFSQHVIVTSSDSTSEITSSNWYTDTYGKVYFTYKYGNSSIQKLTGYVSSTYVYRSADYVFGTCYIYRDVGNVYSTSTIYYLGNDSVVIGLLLYEVELQFNVILSCVSGYIGCKSYLNTFISPIKSSHTFDLLNKTLNFLAYLKAIKAINGVGVSELYTALSAYKNDVLTYQITLLTFIFLSYFKPEPFSESNPRNSMIDVFIYPSSYPLDIGTFKFMLREVNRQCNIDSGWLDVTSLGTITLIDINGRYAIRFTYIPHHLFVYGSTIYCILTIYDSASVPNLYRFECFFGIISDLHAPITVKTTPLCGESDVGLNTDICVIVTDDGIGVDIDSIELYIDGIPIYCTVYYVSNNIVIVYKNTVGFFPGAKITYSWKISDKAGNVLYDSCYFNTVESVTPFIEVEDICSSVVDNRFTFYFDVYDVGSGVKFDTVELILHNKLVDFLREPILFRVK